VSSIRFALCAALLSLGLRGCERRSATAEDFRRGDAIVAALQKYRADHGHYPDRLGSLAPHYIRALQNPDYGERRWDYIHYCEKDTYSLMMWTSTKPGYGYNMPDPKWVFIDNSF
jgi:hypothetical protein